MFARDLHGILSVLAGLVLVAAFLEGALRVVTGKAAGVAAQRTSIVVLVLVGMSAAGGLAMVATGHRPREWLHAVYAVLAFGLVPVADTAAEAIASTRGKAFARVGGSLVALVVVARLFVTG